MNYRYWTTFSAVALIAFACSAQKGTLQASDPQPPREPDTPPPIWRDPAYQNPWPVQGTAPAAESRPVYVYDQRPLGGRAPLVSPEQAQETIARFKEAYGRLGSPRMLIYVNRELVDETSGLKLIKREEKVEGVRSTGGTNETTIRSTGENSYRSDGKATPTLADRQTVRDVERLFGRPLRSAGAVLTDQRVATQLIADRPVAEFIGSTDSPQARKDREALTKIADVVVEVLISAKTVNLPMLSGDQSVSLPDIQATAIGLKDSRILGQASSSDLTSRLPAATLGTLSVQEVAEATALELMADIAQ